MSVSSAMQGPVGMSDRTFLLLHYTLPTISETLYWIAAASLESVTFFGTINTVFCGTSFFLAALDYHTGNPKWSFLDKWLYYPDFKVHNTTMIYQVGCFILLASQLFMLSTPLWQDKFKALCDSAADMVSTWSQNIREACAGWARRNAASSKLSQTPGTSLGQSLLTQ